MKRVAKNFIVAFFWMTLAGATGSLTLQACQNPRTPEKTVQALEPMEVRGPDPIPVGNPELICLAQTVYSESQLSHEQLAVAWTIRNRVESDRYPDSYCDVTRQPYQYSGFNRTDPNYETNINIPKLHERWIQLPSGDYRHRAAQRYEDARIIADAVMQADRVLDTCPGATHFWSPSAYYADLIEWPKWAKNVVADCVIRDRGTKDLRFALYANVP